MPLPPALPAAVVAAVVTVATVLAGSTAIHARELESVQLQHRTAASVIDQVRSLVDDGITIVPHDYELLVRGSDADVAAVREAVERLDSAPAAVRLTLRSGSPTDLRRHGIGVDSDGVRLRGTRRQGQDDTEQVVTGLSGEAVRIAATEERGRTRAQLFLGGRRPGHAESREFVTAERGFYARPAVRGEQVTVELAASREAFEVDGERRGTGVTTTVSGRIGEWLLVGSTRQAEDTEERDLRRYSTRRKEEGTQWWLRVERLQR